MSPVQAITTGLRQSFQVSGRASPAAFRWFAAFVFVLVSAALNMPVKGAMPADFWLIVACLYFGAPLTALVILASGVRRMRDANEAPLVYILPALVAGLMSIGIRSGAVSLSFADTTGIAQDAWSWSGVQSTTALFFCIVTIPLQSLWMTGLCLLPSHTSENSGPNPTEALR